MQSNWEEMFPSSAMQAKMDGFPTHIWVREYLCQPAKAGETKLEMDWLIMKPPLFATEPQHVRHRTRGMVQNKDRYA